MATSVVREQCFFQLTTSRRGRHFRPRNYSFRTIFQLTTSRRGRLYHLQAYRISIFLSTHDLTKRSTIKIHVISDRLYFQLTTSRRGRRNHVNLYKQRLSFNSRPHEEVDEDVKRAGEKRKTFNSRPHEEVDLGDTHKSLYFHLSTHDLTKRSTYYSAAALIYSTFQLTTSRRGRRGTALSRKYLLSFNSRPHEEVDKDTRVRLHLLVIFQLTTSRRGRLHSTGNISRLCIPFNSRPHEEVDPLEPRSRSVPEKDFQLTTSRRGRLLSGFHLTSVTSFNSRPHEEVDPDDPAILGILNIFQLTTSRRGRPDDAHNGSMRTCLSTHDLTKRSTIYSHTNTVRPRSFNSRPHEEVDASNIDPIQVDDLSTHDLTKRSTAFCRSFFHSFFFQLTTSRRGRPP